MARLPRLSLPGYAHHVLQRGNNGQPVFIDSADYQQFLALLHDHARKFEVAVHAYVLMPNHFHLLLTPHSATGLSQMMQAVGRSYVRYFNDLHGRSGTLWEGRYRSTLLQAERYLLVCMVYVDLNPRRAGLAVAAQDYPWSSYGHYAGLKADRLITPHALFWSLANTPFAREAAYAELVQAGLEAGQTMKLTNTVLSGWALGDDAFVANLQKKTDRRLVKNTPGRPPNKKLSAEPTP